MTTQHSEEWELPLITQDMKDSSGEPGNLVDCNIVIWRETVVRLESGIPTDLCEDQFSDWRNFLRWFREELLPQVQIEACKWDPASVSDHLAKLHKQVTQEMLEELKRSLVQCCLNGIRDIEKRLEKIDKRKQSISGEELRRLLDTVSQYQTWQKKVIEENTFNPDLMTKFIDEWNNLNNAFHEFYMNVSKSLLPGDSYHPVVLDFNAILSKKYNTVSTMSLPETDPSLIATRFQWAGDYLRSHIKKLREEFMQPLILALKDTAYEGILDRITTCFEQQEDNAQSFVGECLARAEAIRQGSDDNVDWDKEQKNARMAYPKSRALMNEVLEEISIRTRKHFLQLYFQVLENIENHVTNLETANVRNALDRQLTERKAAQMFWKSFLTKAMMDISNGTAITLVTNLRQNDEYFAATNLNSVGFIRKMWNVVKSRFFL